MVLEAKLCAAKSNTLIAAAKEVIRNVMNARHVMVEARTERHWPHKGCRTEEVLDEPEGRMTPCTLVVTARASMAGTSRSWRDKRASDDIFTS